MRTLTSFFRSLIGPRTFTWQGAVALSFIATVGTVVLYANKANAELVNLVVIFVFAQACALFVYAVSGLLQTRLTRFSAQVAVVVIGYVVFCFVRAYVAEKLLWRADAISENLLSWRFRSNLLVNLPGFVGSAWVMNVSARSRANVDEDLARTEVLEREFSELSDRYSEQRSYGERELALEIASAKQMLYSFESQSLSSTPVASAVEKLRSAVYRADQAVRAMTSNESFRTPSVTTRFPRFSIVDVIDRATRERGVSPGFASLTGFFFAVTYFADYDPQGSVFIRALGIGAVMFLLLWLYRVAVLPRMKDKKRLWRILGFELCIIIVSAWWAMSISRAEYTETLPVALPILTALTSVVVMNVMAGTQSLIDQRMDYARMIQRRNQELENAIAEIKTTMALEESTWKSMFVGNIGRTPTAATVMLRTVVEDPHAKNVGELLQAVVEIWESVLTRLRLVT